MGSCQRQSTRRTCNGVSASCVGTPFVVTQDCGAGSVCNAGSGLCSPTSSTVYCDSTGPVCTSNTTQTTVYRGCNGAGVCNTSIVGATGAVPTCTGRENSMCIGTSCVSLCGNGVDDDGDGYSDLCDPDCTGGAACSAGSCCQTSGVNTGCLFSTNTICNTPAWSCVGNCSRTRMLSNCSGLSTSCNGPSWNETELCPLNTVCSAGACVPASASLFCAASPSCVGQSRATSFFGCAANGSCEVTTPAATATSGATCPGTENSTCVNGLCVSRCADGTDNDGNGFIDGCDAACGGPQCSAGACCDLSAVGSPSRGCYLPSSSLCSAVAAASPSCLSNCSASADTTHCPGNSTACTGIRAYGTPYYCPVQTACSSATGFCAALSATISCGATATTCGSLTDSRVAVLSCNGSSGCLSTATVFAASCAGTEASLCEPGISGCSNGCGNGKDDDGNGLVDCADPACGCTVTLPSPVGTSDLLIKNKAFIVVVTLAILLVLCCVLLLLILAAYYSRKEAAAAPRTKAAVAPVHQEHSSATNPLYEGPPPGAEDTSVFLDEPPPSVNDTLYSLPVPQTPPPTGSRPGETPSHAPAADASDAAIARSPDGDVEMGTFALERRGVQRPIDTIGYYEYDTFL